MKTVLLGGKAPSQEDMRQHFGEQIDLALARLECAYSAYLFSKPEGKGLDPIQAVLFDVLDQLREMKAATEDARPRGIISQH